MGFNGIYQNDAGRVVDSAGNELAVEPDGSLNVNASITASEVEITNDVGNPVPVSGTVTITDGSGPVTVDGTVAVTDGGGSLTVDGTVAVSNFPASVEIANDVGNPIPVSGALVNTPPALDPLGYQQISVGGTAVGLTVPVGADVALIQNNSSGSGARWRDDGVAPTSTVGMLLSAGVQFEYIGDLAAIRFINIGGGNETLNVSYYAYV